MAFIHITHGSGTEEDPYLIENVDCLKEFFDCTVNGLFFKQTEDITVNDISDFENWETNPPEYNSPTNNTQYGGYDGDGHTIIGLYKNRNTGYVNRDYCYIGGFVNCIKSIKNLKFKSSLVIINNNIYNSYKYRYFSAISNGIGGNPLIAENIESEIIFKLIHDTNLGSYPRYFVSGIVGTYNCNNSRVYKCHFKGKVLFSYINNTLPHIYMGGISYCGSENSNYEYCSNTGYIDISSNALKNIAFGGIIVYPKRNDKVLNCYNACNIDFNFDITERSSAEDSSICIGGISGCGYGYSAKIYNCYNAGDISYNGNITSANGELFISGIQAVEDHYVYTADIDKCYNYGKITYDTDNAKIYAYEIFNTKNGNKNYALSENNNTVLDNNFISLTKNEFSLVSSFSDLDFVNIWVMRGERPRLQNNLEPSRYKLSVIPNNTQRGSTTGSGTYDENESVTINASAFLGFTFKGWSDGNRLASRTVVVTSDKVIKAMFASEGDVYNLLDFDGLIYFWNKIKSWFSSNAPGKGASTIGIADSAGIITATDVEGALTEVKTQSDSNTSRVTFIENEYVKRSPSDIISNPRRISNGVESYELVPSTSHYSNMNRYFKKVDDTSYDTIDFTAVSAASTEFNPALSYYKLDVTTGDYVYFAATAENFDENKAVLYYIMNLADNQSWDYMTLNSLVYLQTSSGQSYGFDWNSVTEYPNGFPHTCIMQVMNGHNLNISIKDTTAGFEVYYAVGRDSRGVGPLSDTIMCLKGHSYLIHTRPYRWDHGHDNGWRHIILNFFGD